MYRELPESQNKLFALEVTGTLASQDYETLVPKLESRIAAEGDLALFWEMKDFDGWTAGGLWADTKFDAKHTNDFTRVALVGEDKWIKWMEPLMKPFTSATVKSFPPEQRDEGLAWVRAGA